MHGVERSKLSAWATWGWRAAGVIGGDGAGGLCAVARSDIPLRPVRPPLGSRGGGTTP